MSAYRVLVVDDDLSTREGIAEVLRGQTQAVDGAGTEEEALALLTRHAYDLVITDLLLPDCSGVELIRRARSLVPPPAVVLVTGHASVETAVEALKAGAAEYLLKPIDPHQLRTLAEQLLAGRSPAAIREPPEELVAQSRPMKQVLEKLSAAAASAGPVLLVGEGGTGKELCAGWVHRHGERRRGPFAALHAGGMPPDLVAHELFGAPTRPGRAAQARGGTLFLDDVDALDDEAQARLARLLASGRLVRADGVEEAAELRLVAATCRDLATLVAAGQFREDLFLRLHEQVIALPPLRERREDIAPLARRFVALFAHQYQKPALALSLEAVQQLLSHSWPGNVRELRNALEQAVILCETLEITPELLPHAAHLGEPVPELRFPVGTAIKEMEREMIVRTLDANRGNKNRTAKQLGISRRSLYNKLERYRIDAARHH